MAPVVVSPTTVRRLVLVSAALALAVATPTLLTRAQSAPSPGTAVPGSQPDGTTLLPNGWRLSVVGKHLKVGNFPLNLALSSDGRYAVVTNNGITKPSLSVVDINSWSIKSTTSVDHAWYGLSFSADGTKVYSAGASQNNVQEFTYADGALTKARTFALPAQVGETFAGGLTVSRDGRSLYVTRVFAMTLSAIDLGSGQVTNTVQLPAEPYTTVVSADGRVVYVSLWGGGRVQAYSADGCL